MNEQAAGQPKWRNTLVLLKQRHCVARKPGIVGTQEAKAWRNRLYLSTWGNHLEQCLNPWCLVSGEFLHFYQRLMRPAYVCTAHQCMPGQQAARSGSVLPPQFSHIPRFVGLGRECPPASACYGVV